MAHIVVIDDSADIRQIVRRTLEHAGHTITEAEDGFLVEMAFSKRRPDAVVVDIFMPGKDGISTIRDLRRTYPDLPILAISGGGVIGDVGLLQAAHELGATATLSKPFDAAELCTAIAALLAGVPKAVFRSS